jgi:hypothetical protein
MMLQTAVIRGTLNPDGTLELDGRPEVPAGPVEVTIRALQQPCSSSENWWEFLERSRSELQEAGSSFMTDEDGQAHIQDLRSGDERLDAIYHRMDDERRTGDHVDLP